MIEARKGWAAAGSGVGHNGEIMRSELKDQAGTGEGYQGLHRDRSRPLWSSTAKVPLRVGSCGRLSRVAAYLEARGLRGKNRRNDEAAAGVTAAEQRGTSDWLACEGVITRCVRSCNSRNKTMKCEARCLNQDQRCRSAQRCEYPDNLPF